MDLTCLGIILVDMFPVEVGKLLVEVSAFTPNPGGAPANVAVAARRLGSSVAFIGKVGKDHFGYWLRDILNGEGVQTNGLVFDDLARTSLVFIAMPDENSAEFVFYRNPGADMRLTEDDLDEDLLRTSKALHFDSLSLTNPQYRAATVKAIDIVKDHGGFISYDVNYRPTMWPDPEDAIKATKDVLPYCDVIKVNDIELELITGIKEPERGSEVLINRYGKLCLITLGSKGAYYITRDQRGYMPAYRVKTIDAIGCGDGFLGAILFQLTKFDSLSKALSSNQLSNIVRFATAAGALTSTKRGALPALPFKSDVEDFIRSHK
ncbi:MAG: carbohydrate kinase family protein [Anaerolineales bacterium]